MFEEKIFDNDVLHIVSRIRCIWVDIGDFFNEPKSKR